MAFSAKAQKSAIAKSGTTSVYQKKSNYLLINTNNQYEVKEKVDDIEDDDISEKDDDSKHEPKLLITKKKLALDFSLISYTIKLHTPQFIPQKRYISFHELKINC